MTLSYNPKAPAWYSGGLDNGALQVGSNRGNVYYVNGTDWGDGDNANSGLRPDDPFLTIAHALDQCTSEAFDTIVVVDYWQPTGEVWPIVVDVRQVTIVGAPGGSYNRWCCVNPVGDAAAFSIQAAGVRLIDFYIMAGASHAGVEFSGGPERVGIYGCWFASGTHGVQWGVGEAGMSVQVEDCFFSTYLTGGGIELSNSPHCRVANNVFMRTGGVAINVAHDAHYSQILDNKIAMASDTQGIGITLCATVTEVMVDGNSAFWGETVNNNPYLDNAGANVNCWGLNYHGNTLVLPA